MSDELRFLPAELRVQLSLQYAQEGVRAGFPSPAQDYMEQSLDLNRDLIQHPAATFYARVEGDSMIGCGIYPNDILVIDRSVEAYDGCIAVCYLDGEFTVKELDLRDKAKGVVRLIPHNESYPTIEVTPDHQFEIWGVVSFTIHRNLTVRH